MAKIRGIERNGPEDSGLLIDPYAGPDDDPEADLDDWEGVTSESDPQLPQYVP